jgi:hypothetical protein
MGIILRCTRLEYDSGRNLAGGRLGRGPAHSSSRDPPLEAAPRTTMRYDRARKNLDRHPNYILAAYMASGT